MKQLRDMWGRISTPDTPDVRAAARKQARWRTDVLTVIIGTILIVGLTVTAVMQLREMGLTKLFLWPTTALGVVIGFCVWRWGKWHSTRGRGPGRHRV